MKLTVTSSNWFSLAVVHDKQFYIYVESGLSATSKELPSAFKFFMADQADRCETEAHTKAKEDKCHALRELPPIHATQGRQLGTSNCECEPSWS